MRVRRTSQSRLRVEYGSLIAHEQRMITAKRVLCCAVCHLKCSIPGFRLRCGVRDLGSKPSASSGLLATVELVVHKFWWSVERRIGWQGGSARKLLVKHGNAWQCTHLFLSSISDQPSDPHSQRRCKRVTLQNRCELSACHRAEIRDCGTNSSCALADGLFCRAPSSSRSSLSFHLHKSDAQTIAYRCRCVALPQQLKCHFLGLGESHFGTSTRTRCGCDW